MKSSTKTFLLGMVAGAALLFVLEIGGVMALGFLMSSPIGEKWVADRALQAPHFPPADEVVSFGQTDYDWSVRTSDGDAVPFSEFRGKTVFLNVWATWCPPCVMEMPNIERLYRSVDPSEVAIVLVSKESEEVVRAFLEREPRDLPLYVTDELPAVFDSTSVPITFVLDPGGTIVFKHTGAMRWDDPATVTFLNDLGN